MKQVVLRLSLKYEHPFLLKGKIQLLWFEYLNSLLFRNISQALHTSFYQWSSVIPSFCRICVHLFSGKIVTAVVVKHYRAILRNTVLPGSLKATVVHELKSLSMGMSVVACRCPQPCDPELDWGILSEPGAARPTISWPHSRWLDSCRPRPVVSIGSAHEAKAASRQQQQYTERARYTDDSSITCRLVK